MTESPRKYSTYFATYEQREEAFKARLGALIPRIHHGPAKFWKEFGAIWRAEYSKFSASTAAYIPSSPGDCLAFSTPFQVLEAAVAGAASWGERVQDTTPRLARRFGITANLHQPIRTLSGGETVKLALTKCFAVAPASSRLVVASPYSWLSRNNFGDLEQVVDRYLELDRPVDLLALNGEDTVRPMAAETARQLLKQPPLRFKLQLHALRVRLNPMAAALGAPMAWARFADAHLMLTSPCLIAGENGQGKSLLAKALSGAVGFEGTAVIRRDRVRANARLLFQDVMTQSLMRTPESLWSTSHCGNAEDARPRFDALTLRLARAWPDLCEQVSSRTGGLSLLALKIRLLAARLCDRPGALILDEPDWGLSRQDTLSLVTAVVETAHAMDTPVILVSHKPWWAPLARSAIGVQKTDLEVSDDRVRGFWVRLAQKGVS